ncbi:MAG: lipoyl synthase [Candidatus Eremiobacter antarcticus]|nr:lipoyl synthase [Candidatus Eremiobacteraeota bacterium]MBC5808026.1 lipoyl synthase [Candidatus Eremiobacteraeota bacterium]PZR63434.1 MAG: lipoyl synthase [Candidatus Eremiobacter sp. RRmetagenome_bin22]
MIARKPEWLKVKLPSGDNYLKLRSLVKDSNLHTVCQEAMCPNIAECWGVGTATFMILGDTCTRGCRFCNVKTGRPNAIDPLEAFKLAASIEELRLNYAVITCVDRDDLPDGGAAQMAQAIRAIKARTPHVKVEVLTSDYRGDLDAVWTVVEAKPDVYAHNIETTRTLTRQVRDRRCGYEQSLSVLQGVKKLRPDLYTKSSIMLGLGESDEDVLQTARDLRLHGVDIITFGQYLQPTQKHLKVVEFVTPEKFAWFAREVKPLGFHQVVSGPLVRSSYHAEQAFATKL